MRKGLIALVIVAVVGSAACQPDPSTMWFAGDLDAATSEADNRDTVVMIEFFTDWCGWCKKMDANTYTDKKVIEMINNNFVAVKFNPEKEEPVTFQGKNFSAAELAQAAGVNGYPATAFFESNSTFLGTVPGYRDAKGFLDLLKFILDRKFEKPSQ